ncbi:MAG: relaxase/mobilization nuclease domain-containing protein [Lachnospiraceae bacterium]|nr:relaxase/mobilization nuclease domain-containing protein [Lachnospiraceae bacterium]
MAVIKHISVKNSNYDAAVDYLTLKHDEFTNKPILDENGNKIPKLDEENKEKASKGILPEQTVYKTDKDFLRDAIYAVLSDSPSFDFDSFVKKLFEQYGIAVHESRGAISYVPPGKEKAVRGKRLGTDFEKKHIEKVIAENAERMRTGYEENKEGEIITTVADNRHGKYQSSGIRLIVDLENCIKAQQNQYYARKVKIGNLQQMANTLAFLQTNDIGSVEDLSQMLTSTYEDFS